MRDGKQVRSMERGCDESMFWIRISKLMAADGNVPRGGKREGERERASENDRKRIPLQLSNLHVLFFSPNTRSS